MVIQCTSCMAKFKFNEEKFESGATEAKVRCNKCSHVFVVVSPEVASSLEDKNKVENKAVPPKIETNNTLEPSVAASPASAKMKTDLPTSLNKKVGTGSTSTSIEALKTPLKRRTVQAAASSSSRPSLKRSGKSLKPTFTSLNSITDDIGTKQELPQSMASDLENLESARPAPAAQQAINEETYKSGDGIQSMVFPELEGLKEINFDLDKGLEGQGDMVELGVARDFTYGSSGVLGEFKHTGKKLRYTMRPLSGEKVANAPLLTSVPQIFTGGMKLVLILSMAITLLFASLMIAKGEEFNYHKIDAFKYLGKLVNIGDQLLKEGGLLEDDSP